jgi:hypothetical protein
MPWRKDWRKASGMILLSTRGFDSSSVNTLSQRGTALPRSHLAQPRPWLGSVGESIQVTVTLTGPVTMRYRIQIWQEVLSRK